MPTVIPAWQAPSVGFAGNAGHANQFFGGHAAKFLYTGTVTTQQATGSATFISTQNTYLAQLFTIPSNQTVIGSVNMQINAVGGSPTLSLIPSITVSLYGTAGNVPSGSAIISTTLPSTYVYSSSFWVSIPIVLTGAAGGATYAAVINSVGTSTHYYAVQKSNQVTGAATSPDGITWTAQAYGFMFQVLNQSGTGSGQLQTVYEDNGARVTQFSYNSNGSISKITETTSAQSSTSPLVSTRSMVYTNGLLTGVS